MKSSFITVIMWVGMVLILIGVIIPLFTGPQEDLFKYIYGAGALLNLAGRFFTPYEGRNMRVKRLLRIEVWASLFFCVAIYFMFADPDPKNWIVFVLAGGALLAYTSIMIPIAGRKNN